MKPFKAYEPKKGLPLTLRYGVDYTARLRGDTTDVTFIIRKSKRSFPVNNGGRSTRWSKKKLQQHIEQNDFLYIFPTTEL